MADESGPIVVDETVAQNATPEEDVVAEPRPSRELFIPSEEDLEVRADHALSVEGRLEHAKPVHIACWKCDIMVAPAGGLKLYERVFGNELFARDVTADDAHVDTAFLKELIVACTVKPKLTDALVDKLLEASALDFVNLAAFCMLITKEDTESSFEDILGVVNTEKPERFTAGQDGSTNTPTPV